MSSEHKEEKRRPYEKPRLRVSELAAEEVLGVGCKSDGGIGALQPCRAQACASGLGS